MAYSEVAWQNNRESLEGKFGLTRPLVDVISAQIEMIYQMRALRDALVEMEQSKVEAEQSPAQQDTPANRLLREIETEMFGSSYTPLQAIEIGKRQLEEQFTMARNGLVEPTMFAQELLLKRAKATRTRDTEGVLICPYWNRSLIRRLKGGNLEQKLPVARAS